MNPAPAPAPAQNAAAVAAAAHAQAQFNLDKRRLAFVLRQYRLTGRLPDDTAGNILGGGAFPRLQNRQQMRRFTRRRINAFQPTEFDESLAPMSLSHLRSHPTLDLSRPQINAVARTAMRAGVRFRHLLSAGGMGITSLFEVRGRNGRLRKCVAKMAISGAGNAAALLDEKTIMGNLRGAQHAVQLRTAQELRALPGTYDEQAVKGVLPQAIPPHPSYFDMRHLETSNEVLLMDYHRRGTLRFWIQSIVLMGARPVPDPNPNTPPPAQVALVPLYDEVLWKMLLCMVQGCIALAYPPRFQTTNQNRPLGQMDEYIPNAAELLLHPTREKYHNYVHLDIDPSNIFVGEPDAGEHRVVPPMKMGDFGTALKVDDALRADTRLLWRNRTTGKAGYLLPEQWSAEWDLVDGNPLQAEPVVCDLAGRYGEASNVWQVGMTMMNCITRSRAEDRPWAMPVRIDRNGPHDVLFRSVGPRRRMRRFRSHGYVLADPVFAHHERALIDVLVACLAHEIADRPSLADLLDLCRARMANGNFVPPANPMWHQLVFTENGGPREAVLDHAYDDAVDCV